MVEFDRGNSTAAMAEFDRAKALNPNYGLAYSGMALVYAKQGILKKLMNLLIRELTIQRNQLMLIL